MAQGERRVKPALSLRPVALCSGMADDAPNDAVSDALVTIIIVTWNSRRFLVRQMAALAALNERRWRLIVIDNASAPSERPSVADLPLGAALVQNNENVGFAAANNQAAQLAGTPFLALLNPDAFPAPDWLTELLAAAARWPEAAAFGSTQLLDANPALLDGAGDAMHALGLPYRSLHRHPATQLTAEGPAFSACAAAMLIRADRFHALGGFEPSFFCYCEDVDFGFRLRLAGGETIQAPRAIVRHVAGGAGNQAFADRHGARNRLWTFVRCMPSPFFELLLAPHLLATTLIALMHARDGRLVAQLRGLGDGVRGLPAAFSARRDIQATRIASLNVIARALTWSLFALLRRSRA